MEFYIVPPRKVTSSVYGQRVVDTVNGMNGDIVISVDTNTLTLTHLGQEIRLGVKEDLYVERAGDTVTGNLRFTPTGDAYGLGVYANTADPSTAHAHTGALYFNTADNELKVFHSGSWHPVESTTALNETSADALYLRLDASNDPVTGNINLGSTVLRLGNKADDPITGLPGDIYYNTNLKKIYYYQGAIGGWQPLSVGVTSSGVEEVYAGDHIKITALDTAPLPALDLTNPIGIIDVKQSADFSWTGTHQFSLPVSFAATQTFNIGKLTITSQANGDLILRSGGAWTRMPVGAEGKFLVVNSGLPSWGDGSTALIGLPSDSSYSSGHFGWTGSTTLAQALDDLNTLTASLTPAKPDLLSDLGLSMTGATLYSAKLPSGLATAWYQGGKAAGDSITNYCTSAALALSAAYFWVGKIADSSSLGTAMYRRKYHNGSTFTTVDDSTYALTLGGGTSGNLTVAAPVAHNTLWAKTTASVAYTQPSDGYMAHVINSTISGESDPVEIWLDTVNTSPAFAANPDAGGSSIAFVDITTSNTKWLSGVRYYAANSVLDVSFIAATGIFNRCYHPSHVAKITGTGFSATNVNPSSTPAYNATFDKSGSNSVAITLNQANQASLNKYVTVTLYKPNGTSVSSNAALSYAINTYSSTYATSTAEYFVDESKRLQSGSLVAFDSTVTPVASGYAQVRNGTLQYPVSGDYSGSPSFTGVRSYERKFTKEHASNGTLQFTGTNLTTLAAFSHTDISPYGTGDLNILLILDNVDDASKRYFDLGMAVGSTPGADALAVGTAIGGRNLSQSSNGNIAWSIGNFTTGASGKAYNGEIRVVVYLRANSKFSFTQIVSV